MNLFDYAALKDFTVVASAIETILDPNDELDGAFIWVVYHNDSSDLFFARLDVMDGELKVITNWPYADVKEYAASYGVAMIMLWEAATGRDFTSGAPVR